MIPTQGTEPPGPGPRPPPPTPRPGQAQDDRMLVHVGICHIALALGRGYPKKVMGYTTLSDLRNTNSPDDVAGRVYRFYQPDLVAMGACDGVIELQHQQARHVKKVLRLTAGQAIELFDGQGHLARAQLLPGGGTADIQAIQTMPRPTPEIDLAIAFPKAGRSDDMLNSLSQLGANRVLPLRTARSVVHPSPARLARYETLAIESAKQCGRHHLMQVLATLGLEQALLLDYDLRLIATPGEPGEPGGSVEDALSPGGQISGAMAHAKRIIIFVGPEGGWTDDELMLAQSGGALAWCLGPNVLRIETAGIAALSVARYLAMG